MSIDEPVPYLSSASALIKVLRAPADPPQPDWPSKIQIANAALQNTDFYVPRKTEVLRDWVVDSWSKTPSNLLDPAYHQLLLDVLDESSEPTQAPIQILSSFFGAASQTPVDLTTISAASQSLPLLLRDQRLSTKLETWVEIWNSLLDFLRTTTTDAAGISSLAHIITSGIAHCEISLTNSKKVAQAAHKSFPTYCIAFLRHPSLRPVLNETLSLLIFAQPTLQNGNPLDPLTACVGSSVKDELVFSGFCAAVPDIFRALIANYHTHRYSIFTQASSSKIAHDVFIASKEREVVRISAAHLLGFLDEIEAKKPQQTMLEGVWQARSSIWKEVESWGGYMERDGPWNKLLSDEARKVESTLMKHAIDAKSGSLIGTLLQTLSTLETLDHDQTQIGPDVVRWCLASPPAHHELTSTILSSLLRFFQLTHSLPAFFHLLITSFDGLFDAALPGPVIKSLYDLTIHGPLTQSKLRREICAALRSVNAAKGRTHIWDEVTTLLSDRLKPLASDLQSESKKRKRTSEPTFRDAALTGVVSRLISYCLDSASEATSENESSRDVLNNIASMLDEWPTPSAPELDSSYGKSDKKPKSQAGPSWSSHTHTAGKLRIARGYERLLHRKCGIADDFATSPSTSKSNDDFEWQLEALRFTFHRAALDKQLSGTDSLTSHVDHIIESLASSKQRYGAPETKIMWQTVIEEGILQIHGCASQAQLTRITAMILQEPTLSTWLSYAPIWDMPNFKNALQSFAASAQTSDVFHLLDASPSAYLSRKTRSSVIANLQEADKLGSATQWLRRVVEEGEGLGSLTRDITFLKAVAVSADTDEDGRVIWIRSISHVCQSSNHAVIFELAEYLLRQDLKQATVAFCEQLMQYPKSSFPENLHALLIKVYTRYAQDSSVATPMTHKATKSRNVFVRFGDWLGLPGAEIDRSTGNKLCQAVFQAVKSDQPAQGVHQLAQDALKTLACDSVDTERLVVASVKLLEVVPALDLNEVLRSIFGNSIVDALDTSVTLLEQTTSPNVLSAVLRVITALSVDCKSPETLRRVIRTSLSRATNVHLLIKFMETVSEEKAASLQSDDLARLWPLVLEDLTSQPLSAPYDAILNILSNLGRRRPDLVLSTLPEIIDVLCAIIESLQSPRSASQKQESTVQSDRAHSLARLLIVLAQMRSHSSKKHEISPIAKHVPVLLVSYVRAAADFHRGLTPAVRRELEPGLFALCNLATSGGRVHARGREGEGLGTPFGLGDGMGGEGERELWADLWQSWSKSRYIGQG